MRKYYLPSKEDKGFVLNWRKMEIWGKSEIVSKYFVWTQKKITGKKKCKILETNEYQALTNEVPRQEMEKYSLITDALKTSLPSPGPIHLSYLFLLLCLLKRIFSGEKVK